MTDASVALIDRRAIGRLSLNSAFTLRAGIDLLGAQDEGDRPPGFPTSRFRIFTVDLSAGLPIQIGPLDSWTGEFRGQYSARNLYGSDSLGIGGPFTVRGFAVDRAEIGRTGWNFRQEVGFRLGDHLRPFLLADLGRVDGGGSLLAGGGAGLRALWRGLQLDAFVAAPLSRVPGGAEGQPVWGFSLGWSV